MNQRVRMFLMIPAWIIGLIVLPLLPKEHVWRQVPDHTSLRS